MSAEAYTISPAASDEKPGGRRGTRWRARLPAWIILALAVLLWRIFYPGLLSSDSIEQYKEALSGQYKDWHPPLMSIALRFVLELGGTIALLTIVQCAALLLGLYALATASQRLFWPQPTPVAHAWVSLAIVLLLLVPVTPLAFFAMTFWKDVWAAALLVWSGALLLEVLNTADLRRVALLVGLGVVLGLVRHNALVVLPVLGAGLAVALWRRRRVLAIVAGVAPLLLSSIAEPLIDRAFAVERMHPSSQIMALDLVGLCARSQRVCAELPWTRSHILDPAALAQYRPGDIGFVFWDKPPHVDRAIRLDFPRLRAEYLQAVRTHPLLFACVKLAAFRPLLGRWQTYYFFHKTVVTNPYGLALDPRFAAVQDWLAAECTGVAEGSLRWISGVHLVWLAVGLAWAAVSFAACRRGRRWLHLAVVIALPLAYGASYLFATPVHDFRFLYPTTLFVQCVTLSAALGGLAQKPTGRAPSRATLSA